MVNPPPLYFPSVSISALHFLLSIFPHLRMSQYQSVFFPSSVSGETYSSVPPIQLIIIHLGGRISTAWDIRPITQSRQATSPGPPTFPLALMPRSNLLERTLCLTQVSREQWGVLKTDI